MSVETMDRDTERRAKMRLGLTVAAALAVLTIIEYFVAVGMENGLILLIALAVAKGWLILDYFMHVRAVFGDEGGH